MSFHIPVNGEIHAISKNMYLNIYKTWWQMSFPAIKILIADLGNHKVRSDTYQIEDWSMNIPNLVYFY